jgi:hypothetical protein
MDDLIKEHGCPVACGCRISGCFPFSSDSGFRPLVSGHIIMVPVVTVVQDGANSFAPFAKEIYEGGQGAAANPGSQIYPLVNIQKAIKNYHLYIQFSHEKWWFSIAKLNYQRVDLNLIQLLYNYNLLEEDMSIF